MEPKSNNTSSSPLKGLAPLSKVKLLYQTACLFSRGRLENSTGFGKLHELSVHNVEKISKYITTSKP
jgi:hypothetical protein